MKCDNCQVDFHSVKWYKYLEHPHNLILCDDCLVELLKGRIEVCLNKLNYTQSQIDEINESRGKV